MSKSLRFTDSGFSEVRNIYYYPAVQENHADAFSKSEVINFSIFELSPSAFIATASSSFIDSWRSKLPTPKTASAYRHA